MRLAFRLLSCTPNPAWQCEGALSHGLSHRDGVRILLYMSASHPRTPDGTMHHPLTHPVHRFHIPVMGTGFTIDTPLKVARYGISSVVSLVDDVLTTGATILAARAALEGLPTLALTATTAGRMRRGEGHAAMEAK